MKTRLDVITRALRRIGVAAHDEVPTADQIDNAGAVYDSLVLEVGQEIRAPFSGETIPDELFVPLANLLGVDLCPDYGVPPPTTRGNAFLRVLAVLRPDDRPDVSEAVYL